MKRAAAITLLALALVLPAAAGAHHTGWYWNQKEAARRLTAHYQVYNATCEGWGRFFRDSGKRWFRHFDCLALDENTDEPLSCELHVTGRRGFKCLWREP